MYYEITKSSDTSETPLINRFARLALIPPVDGYAASVYITADAGGGQCREWRWSRATERT